MIDAQTQCTARGRRRGTSQWYPVLVHGQPFSAGYGLLKSMVDAMRAKHPLNEYEILEKSNA